MVDKIKQRFRQLLHLDETPHRIAAAFALGVFIAFSPLLGLHTAMVFLFAWLLRLNAIAVLLGSLVLNPWTFGPLLGSCLWLGLKLYGMKRTIPPLDWQQLTWMNFLTELKPYLVPFVLGTTIVGIVASVIAYFLANYIITQYRQARAVKQLS
jgi:uncharacterized protein (TIGR03546 family)